MTECNTYTGDIQLLINNDGNWDIKYENGQPCMTDGLDTAVILAIYGEPDFWQNELTNDENEKYISRFPALIKNSNINDDTIKDGIAALKEALSFLKNIEASDEITVTGGALNVFAIYWIIDIERPEGNIRYQINWDKQILQFRKAV